MPWRLKCASPMSKTLFWYLLKDLLRIFMLASGTLAGIMSFGALLRPLTQHGLDAGQIGKILSYFSPAMTTYSFPVAALFATTMVYGRLSADNELTACRASGISHLALTWPAFLLGLIVALISLVFLSFIVPLFTLKVEKVIYSNIAQLIANKITRTHEISYGKTTIFAQAARSLVPEQVMIDCKGDAGLQSQVEKQLKALGVEVANQKLSEKSGSAVDVLVMPYEQVGNWRSALAAVSAWAGAGDTRMTAGMFYKDWDEALKASSVKDAALLEEFVKVRPEPGAQMVELDSPMVFSYATVPAPDQDPSAKPDDKASKMRVPTKVWMARRAMAVVMNKEEGVEMSVVLEGGGNFPRSVGGSQMVVNEAQFGPVPMGSPIRENTKFMDIAQLKAMLANPESSRRLQGLVQGFIKDEQREVYFAQLQVSLKNLQSLRFIAESETLVVSAVNLKEATIRAGELVLDPADDGWVRVDRESNGNASSSDKARQVRITIDPVEHAAQASDPRMIVNVRGYDVMVTADEDLAAHEKFPRSINIPMPADLRAVEKHTVDYYRHSNEPGLSGIGREARKELDVQYHKLTSSIRSEMHSRASFAVSCLILVMVGCALGMISKSGNFLSAFAVSVVPALLCITLIVTGQHVCENTPKSEMLGLSLIWSGNVIVAMMATVLLGGLQRQ